MVTTTSHQLSWKSGALAAFVLGVLALLVACGGGSSSSPTDQAQSAGQEAGPPSESAAAVPPGWRPRVPGNEVINGITVPPEPAPSINKATIVGVDSNKNGVRDDVERLVARDFGTEPVAYQQAFAHARTLQTAITAPSSEASRRHLDGIRCLSDDNNLSRLEQITLATLNVSARQAAYARAFVGATISKEGCTK
jgi:hypothetical protein